MRPAPGPACTAGVTPAHVPACCRVRKGRHSPPEPNSLGNVQVVWGEAPRAERDQCHKLLWCGLHLWGSRGLPAEALIVQILLSLLRSLVSPAGACPGGSESPREKRGQPLARRPVCVLARPAQAPALQGRGGCPGARRGPARAARLRPAPCRPSRAAP